MNFLQFLKKHILTTKIIPILFLVLGFVIYTNCFYNEMFWDDDDFILKNRYIQDWQYWPKYFSENLVAGNFLLSNYWRPVLLTLFSIEWHLWKNWVIGYHVVSISLHVLVSVLLFFFLNRLFKNLPLAFLTSLIFLIHPIHTEAVVYPNAVSDPLGSCFLFAGLIAYLKFRAQENLSKGWIFLGLSILCFLLGLMTRETVFMMPAYLFICDWIVLGKLSIQKKIPKIFKTLIPFFLIAAVYLALRATVLNFNNTFNFYKEENIFTGNFLIRLLTFFRVLSTYAGLLFFPVDLHVERSVPIAMSIFSASVIFGAGIFCGLWAWAIKSLKDEPIVSFGILWFFIGIFPSSNLVIPINALLYEHFLYLPSIGIFLILFYKILNWKKLKNFQSIATIILLLYIAFFCITTIERNRDWKDPVTFYEDLLKHAPKSYRVINNLGMEYADRGIYEKAESIYKKAIAVEPTNPVGYHNLAGTFRDTGRRNLAAQYFQHAIELDPKFIFSYRSLAQLYYEAKDYPKARQALEHVLEISPDKVNTLTLLAQLAYEQKNFSASRNYLKQALKYEPRNIKLLQLLEDIKNK